MLSSLHTISVSRNRECLSSPFQYALQCSATSGADTIKTFPRNIASTVRRVDTTRKDARDRKKQRQEEELEKKREEVRRLKALKMKEVRRKLERIGREGGVEIDPNAEGLLYSRHLVMTLMLKSCSPQRV